MWLKTLLTRSLNNLMRNLILLFISLALCAVSQAQELNCQVVVNAQLANNANLTVFKTLERSLQEFVNNSTWTNKSFNRQERINCSMFITINEQEGQNFNATIQVQAIRPVYGSTLESTTVNFNDEQFSFVYTEFQPLNYDPNSFNSNLVSVISFYVYTILGIDADTFAPNGGTAYLEEAKQIVVTAQQGQNAGWKASDGANSRFRINDDLLSNAYSNYREAMYIYHRQGLDLMHQDQKLAKENVAKAIQLMRDMYDNRPNSLLNRVFFDAKADEVQAIFSGGPSISIKEVVDNLNRTAPFYSDNWRSIKF